MLVYVRITLLNLCIYFITVIMIIIYSFST